MRQDIIAVFYRKAYWFHQAETGRRSVAGVHVNMPAPEALRTVIGIAVPLDSGTTLHADKIFNVALKFFLYHSSARVMKVA